MFPCLSSLLKEVRFGQREELAGFAVHFLIEELATGHSKQEHAPVHQPCQANVPRHLMLFLACYGDLLEYHVSNPPNPAFLGMEKQSLAFQQE